MRAKIAERKGRDGKIKKANWKSRKTKAQVEEDKAQSQSASLAMENSSEPTLPEEVVSFEKHSDSSKKSLPEDLSASLSKETPQILRIEVTQARDEPNESISEPELIQHGLSALAKVCRMQSREFERRAAFIDRILPQGDFSKAELELLACLARDTNALQPVESFEWFDKTTDLRAVCHLLSELLMAADDHEDSQACI